LIGRTTIVVLPLFEGFGLTLCAPVGFVSRIDEPAVVRERYPDWASNLPASQPTTRSIVQNTVATLPRDLIDNVLSILVDASDQPRNSAAQPDETNAVEARHLAAAVGVLGPAALVDQR